MKSKETAPDQNSITTGNLLDDIGKNKKHTRDHNDRDQTKDVALLEWTYSNIVHDVEDINTKLG